MILASYLALTLGAAPLPPALGRASKTSWTILFYGAANNSCEETLLPDIAAMKSGFVDAQGIELVLFVDRVKGFSDDREALGEDFEDSRLYRITHGRAERLDGGEEFPEITKTSHYEANTGDPLTVRKLVRFGKRHFPAQHYALVFYSHGDGRGMCVDTDNGNDELFASELTDDLAEQDSVDLIGFDVCSMGGIENAYQLRARTGKFGADAMVASAPVSGPWPYARIFSRLRARDDAGASTGAASAATIGAARASADGARAANADTALDPRSMMPLDLARAIVDAKRDSLLALPAAEQAMMSFESWGAFDLSKAETVKRATDAFAAEIARAGVRDELEELRGAGDATHLMHYMPPGEKVWSSMPFFDLYALAHGVHEADWAAPALRDRAASLMRATDDLVVSSFGLAAYPGFESGKHGLYIVFPGGDPERSPSASWEALAWYRPAAKNRSSPRYEWCRDGARAPNGPVATWFDLLDSWYGDEESPERADGSALRAVDDDD